MRDKPHEPQICLPQLDVQTPFAQPRVGLQSSGTSAQSIETGIGLGWASGSPPP